MIDEPSTATEGETLKRMPLDFDVSACVCNAYRSLEVSGTIKTRDQLRAVVEALLAAGKWFEEDFFS